MIIKIQRPLETNAKDGDELAMIYNTNRSYSAMVALDDVAHLFKNNEVKIYHKAKVTTFGGTAKPLELTGVTVNLKSGEVSEARTSDTKLLIGRRVQDQPW